MSKTQQSIFIEGCYCGLCVLLLGHTETIRCLAAAFKPGLGHILPYIKRTITTPNKTNGHILLPNNLAGQCYTFIARQLGH